MSNEPVEEGRIGICAATLCVDSETAAAVKQAIARKNGDFAGELGDYARYDSDELLWQKLQRAEVPLWIIDFDRDRQEAVEAANGLQQTLHGRGSLIAVSARADPALILEAMRAGCAEYLTKPVAADQVAEALDRLRSRLNVRQPLPAKPMGRILALLGARGGAGTTTLAVHLGCFLVRQHGKRTLILDEHRRLLKQWIVETGDYFPANSLRTDATSPPVANHVARTKA